VIQRHEAVIGELRQAAKDQEQNILNLQRTELNNEVALMERCEARISSSRAELIGEMSEMINAAGWARKEAAEVYKLQEIEHKLGATVALRGDLETRFESLNMELRSAVASARADLDARIGETRLEFRTHSEEFQTVVKQDISEVQQRLITMLRSEMTQAFRSEAAAVTAFDQQIKRRIDGMASQNMHERAQRELASVKQRTGHSALASPLVAEAMAESGMSQLRDEQLQGQEAVARLGSVGLASTVQSDDHHHHLGGDFSLSMFGAQNAALLGDAAHGTVRAGHGFFHHIGGTSVAGGSLSVANDITTTTSSLLAEDAQRAKEEVAWLATKKI